MLTNRSMLPYLINRSRVKYEILDQLFKPVVIDSDEVIFHLDANAILQRLYRERDPSLFYAAGLDVAIRDLVVSFLNTVGHYRRYLMTRLHKNNKVLIYFNTKNPEYQTSINSDYRSDWYEKLDVKSVQYGALTTAVTEAFKFIASLVPYFEGIYLIGDTGVDDYTAIDYFKHQYKDAYHIIFTRNMLLTQLVDDHTLILYNKRDDSWIITPDTVYANGLLRDAKYSPSIRLTAPMVPLFLSVSGFRDVNIRDRSMRTVNVAKTIKTLTPYVDSGIITPDISIQSFIDRCTNVAGIALNAERTMEWYRLFNLDLSVAALTKSQQVKMCQVLIDLFDQNGLEDINNALATGHNAELLEITNLNMSTKRTLNDNEFYEERIEEPDPDPTWLDVHS